MLNRLLQVGFVFALSLEGAFASAGESEIIKAFARYQIYFTEATAKAGIKIVDEKGHKFTPDELNDSAFDWAKAYFLKTEDDITAPYALHFAVDHDAGLNQIYFTLNALEVNDSEISALDFMLPSTELTVDINENYDTNRNKIERSVKNFSTQILSKVAKSPKFGFYFFRFFETAAFASNKSVDKMTTVIGGMSSIALGFYIYRLLPKTRVKDKKIIATRLAWNITSASLVLLGLRAVYNGLGTEAPQFEVTDLGRAP